MIDINNSPLPHVTMNTMSTAMQPGMGTNSLNIMRFNSLVVNRVANMYTNINKPTGITMNTGNSGFYGQPQSTQFTQPANLNLLGSGVSTINTSFTFSSTSGAVSLPYDANFNT
jgi:hypothetical protein